MRSDWEEQFNNRFSDGDICTRINHNVFGRRLNEKIKDFISLTLTQERKRIKKFIKETFRPFDLVEDCEPDCTPVRHALHEGSWKAHLKAEKMISDLLEKLGKEE